MNERIKELKHQASLWCDRNIPEQYSEETNSYGSAWEDKFAELLIRECMEVTVNYPHPQTKLTAAEHIARHFGVEE